MSLDLAALGLRAAEPQTATQVRATSRGTESLGQQDFLTLLVTQLRNQDPLNPMDNEAFVAQLAQFSTVSGITEMNASLKSLAAGSSGGSRADAPQWIGRSVASAAGTAGIVRSVTIAADGSLRLTLDDGSSLALADVASVA